MKFKKFKFGFTLVEALVIMTVAAVIVAAATPLITRKVAKIQASVGKNPHGSYECVRITPNTVHERLVIGNRVQYDRTVSGTECRFTPPANAEDFRIRAVGGGGAGGGPGDTFMTSYRTVSETDIKNIENNNFPAPTIFPRTLGVTAAAANSLTVDNWFQWRTLDTNVNSNAYNAVVTSCSGSSGNGADHHWNSNYDDWPCFRAAHRNVQYNKVIGCVGKCSSGCSGSGTPSGCGCGTYWCVNCCGGGCSGRDSKGKCTSWYSTYSCSRSCGSLTQIWQCSASCNVDTKYYSPCNGGGSSWNAGGGTKNGSSPCTDSVEPNRNKTLHTFKHGGGIAGRVDDTRATDGTRGNACTSMWARINTTTPASFVPRENGANAGLYTFGYSNNVQPSDSGWRDGGPGTGGRGSIAIATLRGMSSTVYSPTPGTGACEEWRCLEYSAPDSNGYRYCKRPQCNFQFNSLECKDGAKIGKDGKDGYLEPKSANCVKGNNSRPYGNSICSDGKYNFDYPYSLSRATKQLAYGDPGKNATMVDTVIPKITGTISVRPGLGGTWDNARWNGQRDSLNKNGPNGQDTIIGTIVAKGAKGGEGAQKTDVYQMCSIYDRASNATDCTQQVAGGSNTPAQACSCNTRQIVGAAGPQSGLTTSAAQNRTPGKGGDGGGSRSIAEFNNTIRWVKHAALNTFVYKDDAHRWNGTRYVGGSKQEGPNPAVNVNPNQRFMPTGINGTNGAVVITW